MRSVPLASMGLGQFKYKDSSGNFQTLSLAQMNQIFNQVGINPTALSVLVRLPRSIQPMTLPAVPAIVLRRPGRIQEVSALTRPPRPLWARMWDAWIGTHHCANLLRSRQLINDKITSAPQFPDTAAPQSWTHPLGGVIGHTWTINNRMVNNFRYGYTREAFSNLGDSQANALSFRFIFSRLAFTRTLSRTTPVHNLTDDISWVKGNHTFQFGTAMWFTNNGRTNYSSAFDSAITNPSFYAQAGATESNLIKASWLRPRRPL